MDVNRFYINSREARVGGSEYVFLDSPPAHTSDCITLLFMNIRSIPTNLQCFTDLVIDSQCMIPDVLGFTETRLDSNIAPLYNLSGYNFYNNFRNRNGGGVALYVTSCFHSHLSAGLSLLNPSIECLGVDIDIEGRKYLIICIYRPPSGNVNDFLEYLTETLSTAGHKKYRGVYILGDFNLDLLKHNDNNYIGDFINLMFSFSLFPFTTKPTRVSDTTASIIDHIWSDQVECNLNNFIIHTDITDHFPIASQFKLPTRNKNSTKLIQKRMITEDGVNAFQQELSRYDWSPITLSLDSNKSFNLFYDNFCNLFHEYFPLKHIKISTKTLNNHYITSGLRNSIKEKHRIERLAKKYPLTYREYYRKYRNNLTSLLKTAKSNYYKDQLAKGQGDPKAQWKTINSILGRNTQNDNSSKITLSPPCHNVPSELNMHFIQTTEATQTNHANCSHYHYLNNPTNFSMYLKPVNVNEVEMQLRNLSNTAPGYDDIPPKLLKQISTLISIPLTHIINLCFQSGTFPDKLKIAKVVPLHKSGSKEDINNYRPISLLPSFSKIFEKLISTRLVNYLEHNKLLTDCQHGFRENHSTESAILQFVSNAYKYLDNKYLVAGVYLDLSKAFDSLNHKILLDKLEHIGIRGIANQLFKSYITHRKQTVFCNSSYSNFTSIVTGVPQGSILGPILFLIYINDITKSSTKFKFTIYADDTSLLLADKNA